jgi:hypothetical protein
MHIKQNNVEENFQIRRLCDGKWEHMSNLLADPRYPAARPVCPECKSRHQGGKRGRNE